MLHCREGTAYRTKQFLSKQTHNRTASTDQKLQKHSNTAYKGPEKPRAISQQARRDKFSNSFAVHRDNSMDESMNASFILNNSKYLPGNTRQSNNHSFDTGPRSRSSHKPERPSMNITMQHSGLRGRNSSKEAITDSKYYTTGLQNSSAKKASNMRKQLI